MTGAIAATSCVNHKILHIVCVRSDATLGHLIGKYDEDDNITWETGPFEGQASKQSKIAIGCRDPLSNDPVLDVIYQDPTGAVVSRVWDHGTWSDGSLQSEGDTVHQGTDFAVYYHASVHGPIFHWQSKSGIVGPNTKDGTVIPVPLGARFDFVVGPHYFHFYFLDSTVEKQSSIHHFFSANDGLYYDPKAPQMVASGTVDFRIVEKSVSIIQSNTAKDGPKSAVRLLEQWRNEDFQDWVTFSGADTYVDHTIGFTVLSEGDSPPAVCITYVNAKTGDLIYLPARQGGSLGDETIVTVAKGWFQPMGPVSGVDDHGDSRPLPVESGPDIEIKQTGFEVPEKSEKEPTVSKGPSPQLPRASSSIEHTIEEEAPEWARKYCKDILAPRSDETVNKTARPPADSRCNAVLAPLPNLWNLGTEPLTYMFLEGPHGGNETQRDKVRTTIPEWSWYANVSFKEVGPGEYSHMRITFDPDDGSWSHLGNHSTKEPATVATMNLGWVVAHTKYLPKSERGVILHEFGHALGLMHEHQSPAHGSKSVLDPEATIEFYMKDQGWTRQMVLDQVIKTYNLHDVSNFSEVDTKSIMHYYQPAEITGGEHIDYNYVFSERDKAYMVINYPRSVQAEKNRKQGLEVTLHSALQTVGITNSAPDLAKKILDVRDQAIEGNIDVDQIRQIFTKWAKDMHTVKDEKLEPVRQNYMRGLLDHHQGLNTVDDSVIYLDGPDTEPCLDDEVPAPITSSDSNKARAVVSRDIFTRRPKLDRPDGDASITRLTWTVVRDPAGGKNRVPSEFEYNMITEALSLWTDVVSITVDRIDATKAQEADLVIVFQDIDPATGGYISIDDNRHRSYCRWSRFDPAGAQGARATLYPQIPHDICYRGMVTSATASQPAERLGKWEPLKRTKRTLVHELGHYFGLAHETLGYWCQLYQSEGTLDQEERRAELAEAAKQRGLRATIFDKASVMDLLRVDDEDREVWTTNGFRATFTPSYKDRDSFCLFHAGPHLTDKYDKNKKTFSLLTLPSGQSKIAALGAVLAIPFDTVSKMEAAAIQGEWSKIRKLFIDVKRQEALDITATLSAATDSERRRLRRRMQGQNPKSESPTPMHAPSAPGPIAATPSLPVSSLPGPEAAFAAPMPPLKEVLWSKLNELFGPSKHASSFLTIQSPARYLDKAEFSYKMEGVYSNFVKPVVVNEAEFRLTDQLYEPLRVVGAPNGKSLSITYEMIINNLVPRYQSADLDIRMAREMMRRWLLQGSGDDNAFFVNDAKFIGGEHGAILRGEEAVKAVRKRDETSGPRVANRMEICQRLMTDYLEASKVWKAKHSKMIQDAMNVHTEGRLQLLEDAAREIANTAAVENSAVSAKYSDVVVRGHLHTVRECLAQLDIKSTAEFLQDAKDSLRESAVASLYGASRVLPVIMTPMDWAEGLDTSFDPHDLTADPAIIAMNVTAKSRQLDTLRSQLSALQFNIKGDEVSLRAAMDTASEAYSKAQAELAGVYQDSARALAERIVLGFDSTKPEGVSFAKESTHEQEALKAMITTLSPLGTIKDLFQHMTLVNDARQSMNAAGAKFSQRQTDWVRAKSATTAEQEAAVSRKIDTATTELEALRVQLKTASIAKTRRSQKHGITEEEERVNAANMASGDPTKPIKLPSLDDLAPEADETAPSGSRWIQVMITSKEAGSFESTASASEVERGDWSIPIFGLAGATGGNVSADAKTRTKAESKGLDVDISMNCTLVTVDRSSWFQPQFFDMAESFMRNNSKTSWNAEWPAEWQEDTSKVVDDTVIKGTLPPKKATLPCYPTGYIIAKDVVIKISQFQIRNVADKTYLDEKTTKGGNFLFFSTAKTTQKTSESASSNFQMASNGMVVRIAGPQIIGYIQQMLPYDATTKYDPAEALRPEIFLPGDNVSLHADAHVSMDPKVSRGMGPSVSNATATHPGQDTRAFSVRSVKPAYQYDGSTGRSDVPSHAQAPRPDNAGDGGPPKDHVHSQEEMDHAMKLITEKVMAKLNSPGFLQNFLS